MSPDLVPISTGTLRGRYVLEESMEQCGAGRGVVADKNGTVFIGVQAYQIAQEKGFSIKEVHSTGERMIAGKRTDLDLRSERAQLLAYLDNRSSQVGYRPDKGIVLSDYQKGVPLQPFHSIEGLTIMARGLQKEMGIVATTDEQSAQNNSPAPKKTRAGTKRIQLPLPPELMARYKRVLVLCPGSTELEQFASLLAEAA